MLQYQDSVQGCWHQGVGPKPGNHTWPETSEARISLPTSNSLLTESGTDLNSGTWTFQGIVTLGSNVSSILPRRLYPGQFSTAVEDQVTRLHLFSTSPVTFRKGQGQA